MSVREVPAVEAACDQCGQTSPVFDDEKVLREALTLRRNYPWMIESHLTLCWICHTYRHDEADS